MLRNAIKSIKINNMLRKTVPDQFSQLELTIMNDAFYRQNRPGMSSFLPADHRRTSERK
ncbi:hypothetical protein ENTCAN_05703 [Enterobacter cancerogenus ATCC 35316]|nr:hypothetical protein ENTCAN_05703 [Enterobacter cancerogenus ATCC 35316]